MPARRGRNNSDSEGDSPERSQGPLADILNLSQQLTPSKSPRRLDRLRAEIQARANDADEANLPSKPPRKLRKRFNRADDADKTVPNPATIEERTRAAGRHFVVEQAQFLVDVRVVWTVELDKNFDFAVEFESKATKVQGQLHDIPWIAGAFLDGMSGQRSTISNRLRHTSLPVLAEPDQLKHFRSSSSRFEAFAKLIGYKAATETKAAYYSDGTVNVDKIFRNPLLLKIYACILRGPYGAEGLFEGLQPALWWMSPDTKLTEVGNQTRINYRKRHALYAQRLRDGIRNKKSWAVDLLKYWDSVLFPNRDDSADPSRAHGEEDDEMDQVDQAFDAAPYGADLDNTTPTPEQSNASSQANEEPNESEPDEGSRHNESQHNGPQVQHNEDSPPPSPTPPPRRGRSATHLLGAAPRHR
ncbi:hypothetical protein C8R45DRAFT_1114022 [Mycena sanguinolenta]|nr:hypothetical protein C8R45DRAFT_1114022 [Mycena sanguinolenta]